MSGCHLRSLMMNLSEIKTEVKYLPCPFCGGQPIEIYDMFRLSIECRSCGVRTRGVFGTFPSVLIDSYNLSLEKAFKLSDLIRKNRAAELWNKRIK